MSITLHQIVDAVEATLSAAGGLVRSQTFDALTEGIGSADLPLLQVYPESLEFVDPSGSSDRMTFGGAVRQEVYVIHADVYCRQRSHIGEDMAALVKMIDAITDVLEAQDCPPFGLAGIKSWQWSWSRVQFEYAGAQFVGARFVLHLRIY